MGKGTGQVRNESSTQAAGPWEGQAPHLRQLYQSAANLPLQQHYPGQTVAAQAPETQQALGMTSGIAQAGANQPRVDQWNQTLQGDYLYNNPGFNAALGAAHNRIAPMVQGQFESGGRYGSGLAQEAETSALADAFAGMYGQERGNQMQAMGMASPAYTDAAALGQVGAQQEAYQQALLSDQLQRWNFAQQAPYDRIQAQSGVLQGGFPGGSQITESFGKPGLFDIASVDLMANLKSGGMGGELGNIWDRMGSYGDI